MRYTNYVRLPADHVDETDMFRARAENSTQEHNNLLPENDPERDFNEIRYQRLQQQGRFHEKSRTYEACGQEYNLQKKRNGVKIQMDDSRVIPYNIYFLLKYGTHINVEYVFGQKACKYIFKYLLKG